MWTDRRWRARPLLAGSAALLVVLVAVPAGLVKAGLHWPGWLIAGITAGAGVIVSAALTPVVSSRVKVVADQRLQRDQLLRRAVGGPVCPWSATFGRGPRSASTPPLR